jgi:hypothetical protein
VTEELSSDPLTRYAQLRDNPWLFLKFAVFTHDEVDQVNPIKQFPSHLTYLYFLTIMWQKHRKIAVPKSRRLTVSWTYIALGLWDCIFHKGRSWAFVSKKEEDSKELVQRANFIYEHIPADVISPDLLPKRKRDEMQSSPPCLEFSEIHSKIMGFPSGANQMRQRGFSGLFFDEVAFWDDAEAAFASAEPTVKGGGRMILVSTRFPGFFKRVVYDQLDAKSGRFPEIPPVPSKSPMEGVDVWTNPRNGFVVIDLSHRANPAKRDPAFEAEIRKSLPIRLFRLEYGKSWEVHDGKAVYEDFNEALHTTNTKPSPHVGLPLLLGWDSSGLTPAVVIAQMQEDRLVIFREIIGEGMGAVRFIPHVISILRTEFPGFTDLGEKTINFFDPAGFKKNEITEETYIQALNKAGFRQLYPGPMTWNKRVDAVTELLTGLVKGQSKFLIYESECPTLVAGFKGGYRYPDSNSSVEPDKPRAVKDIHSHPHDALQYLAGGLKNYRATNYATKIPTPSYGFQRAGDA